MLLALGCSDPFEIRSQKDLEPCLAVDGLVIDSLCRQYVRLTMTESFSRSETTLNAVSNAAVTVSDGCLSLHYVESPDEPGLYLSPDEFRGKVGRTYTLSIDAEVDGRLAHFEASDVLPEHGAQVDSIDYAYSPDLKDTWTLAIWGREYIGEGSRYLIQTAVNGHFRPLDQSVEFPDVIFDGMRFEGITIAALQNTPENHAAFGECFKPLETGDVVTLRVSTLSPGYGEFLANYSHYVFGTIPVLMDQPSILGTNLRYIPDNDYSGTSADLYPGDAAGTSNTSPGIPRVVGYFGCASISQASVTVDDPLRTSR